MALIINTSAFASKIKLVTPNTIEKYTSLFQMKPWVSSAVVTFSLVRYPHVALGLKQVDRKHISILHRLSTYLAEYCCQACKIYRTSTLTYQCLLVWGLHKLHTIKSKPARRFRIIRTPNNDTCLPWLGRRHAYPDFLQSKMH